MPRSALPEAIPDHASQLERIAGSVADGSVAADSFEPSAGNNVINVQARTANDVAQV